METRLPEEGYTRYSYSDTPRGELVKMYHELQDENQRLRGLLRWADPYLENWLLYLEDNTAKDIDDLVELMGKVKKELSNG